ECGRARRWRSERLWQPLCWNSINVRERIERNRRSSANHAEDVAFLHDEQVFAVDLDLGARPFAKQHAVAGLEVERNELARLVARPGTDSDDFAFLRLFLGAVGNDDATLGLLFAFKALDHDPVMQGTERHIGFFPYSGPATVRKIFAGRIVEHKACWHSPVSSANRPLEHRVRWSVCKTSPIRCRPIGVKSWPRLGEFGLDPDRDAECATWTFPIKTISDKSALLDR